MRLVLASIAALLCLAIVLWRADWGAFRDSLHAIHYAWVVPAAVAVLAASATRAARWRLLAGRADAVYMDYWRSVTIGYLLNSLFPARPGEVARCYVLSRQSEVRFARAAIAAVLDRASDGLGLAAFLGLALLGRTDIAGRHAVAGLSAAYGVAVVLILLLIRLRIRVRNRIASLELAWVASWAMRRGRLAEDVFATLESVTGSWRAAGSAGLTVVAFACDFVAIYALMLGFGWTLPPLAAVSVATFSLVGSILIPSPAGVGVIQATTILALRAYGVPEGAAVSLSLVYQLLVVLLFGVCGSYSLAVYGLSVSALRRLPQLERPAGVTPAREPRNSRTASTPCSPPSRRHRKA